MGIACDVSNVSSDEVGEEKHLHVDPFLCIENSLGFFDGGVDAEDIVSDL